jgi:hypothetical protein
MDLIRDPYVLEFTGLAERPSYSENDLEQECPGRADVGPGLHDQEHGWRDLDGQCDREL